ncbi:putative chromatin regulator PHD family [Helianthus annuus]|nr:putative chromatin regulator PHD family [Helianthus annuus]
MMLIRSLPTSIDDCGKQESSCVWLSVNESWHESANPVPVTKHNNNDNTLWSRNVLSSSQLSTGANMSETSTLNHVYKRRMTQRKCTLVYKRRKVQLDSSKSGSVDGEIIESNIDLGSASLKQQMDDVGECSSSSVAIVDGTSSCFSFLKQYGVLERRVSTKKPTSSDNNVWCLKACKVCDRVTKTLKMLICDLCEEPVHMSCCNPVIKKVPVGDWFCNSCSRTKLKKMESISGRSSENSLGPIASMLRDSSDGFRSNVRIGEDFQAEVPDWSGPIMDDLDDYLKLMEVSLSECASYQECATRKLSKLSSIGNWLQCREVVNGVDGSVCGKWRRAPLFEVQSDDWECFSSVLWDPTHADCAVPQELDTDQVLKQLKYIEMLRPRLSAKRWKLGVNKHVDRNEHTEVPRNTQKS